MNVTEIVEPLKDDINRQQHRAPYDASASFFLDRQFLKVGLRDDLSRGLLPISFYDAQIPRTQIASNEAFDGLTSRRSAERFDAYTIFRPGPLRHAEEEGT
jgi:hypothetical protein